MDEERHAKEKQKICDGQAEDEDVRHRLLQPEFIFFDDGVDDDAVAYYANEADKSVNAWHENIVILFISVCRKKREYFTVSRYIFKKSTFIWIIF